MPRRDQRMPLGSSGAQLPPARTIAGDLPTTGAHLFCDSTIQQGRLTMRALLASLNQQLYEVTISGADEIADYLRDPHIEAISSACGGLDFWVTPSLRPPHQKVNRPATRMLLNVTRFTAAQVPILSGNVVVTSHGPDAELAPLSRTQLQRLVAASCGGLSLRSQWVLDRRCDRVARTQRRQARVSAEIRRRRFWHDLRVRHQP